MTRNNIQLLLAALFLLLLAFSTGSPAFLAPAVLFILLLLYAPLSVLVTRRRLRIELHLLQDHIRRGENASLTVRVALAMLFPVAPVRLRIGIDSESPSHLLEMPRSAKDQTFSLTFPAQHAGCMHPRVLQCEISDLFSLFTIRFEPAANAPELLVLPVDFKVDPLVYTQVDARLGTMAKANEDITSPSDIRSYQTGDPLKKIHWKLTARKQELLVRKFEEPILPDALLLLNCESPGSAGTQDALLETAYSVIKEEIEHEHVIRLPLLGVHPTELEGRMGLPLIAENLARLQWSHGSSFEEVLLLESRRLRSVGATVIVTYSLNGDLVETMCQMRRMGPSLRLYMITMSPSDPELLPFVSRLQQADCEVCYVTPAE